MNIGGTISQVLSNLFNNRYVAGLAVTVTVQKKVAGDYNPTSGAPASADPGSETVPAVTRAYSLAQVAHSGGLLQVGDRGFLFRGTDLAAGISVGSEILDGGRKYRVREVTEHRNPSNGSEVMLYECIAGEVKA